MRRIAKSGKYNVDVVIKVNDGDTKNKLSATEKYAKQTENRLKALNRIKASPSVRVNDKASSVVNRINSRIRSIKRSVSSTIRANDRASTVINRVKSRMSSIANKPKDLILSAKDKVSDVVGRVKAKIQNLKAETIVKITGKAEQAMSTISRTQSKLKEFVGRKYQATVTLIDNASNALAGLDGKITSFTSGATRKFVAMAAAAATAIGGIGVGSAVKGFADFEQSMKNVQAVSGATQQEFQQLTTKARYMGKTTKFTAKESADAFYYMGMAGWKSKEMLSAIPDVLNLASAGQTDLALTSDIVTDGLTALGLTAKDTGMFVDTMAATVTNSNTDITMMGETFKYVGSMGGALGVSMKDLSLATGLMASAAVKGSMAGTALRGGLVRLIDPPAEAASTLKKYGIEISKTKDGNLDLAKTIGTLREKLGSLDGVTKSQALSAILGKNALSGWSAVVNASEEEFQKLAKAIEESEGAAKRMADMKLDTISGQWEILKSAIDDVRISVGDRLGPLTRGFIENLTAKMPQIGDAIVSVVEKFVNNFDRIKASFQLLLPVIGIVIGAMMLFKAGFGIMMLVVNLSKLATALNLAGISALFAQASIFLIPIAIAAVIVMFAGLALAISDNKQALLDLQNKFGIFGMVVGNIMETVGGMIKLVFGSALKIIGGVAEAIGIIFSKKSGAEKLSALKSLWIETFADIKASGKAALSDMGAETTMGVEYIRKTSANKLQGVKNAFSVALDQTANIAGQKSKQAADAIAKGLKGIDDEGLRAMRGLNDQMAIILSGVTADMDIKTKTDKIARNLSDAFKAGKISAEEYKNGIIETMNFIEQNCANSTGNIKQSLSDSFNAFKDGMNTGGVGDAVTGMLNSVKEGGEEMQAVLQGLGGDFGKVFEGVNFSSPIEDQKKKVIENLKSLGLEGQEAINFVRRLFNSAAEGIDLGGMKEKLSSVFNSFKEGMNSGGMSEAIGGMVNSISLGGEQIQKQLSLMGGDMAKVLKDVDFKAPLDQQSAQIMQNFKELGLNGEQAINLMREQITKAANQLNDVGLKDSLSNALNAFGDGAGKGGIDQAINGMLNSLKAGGEQAQLTVQSMGGNISKAFEGVDFSSSIETQKGKILSNLQALGLEGPAAIEFMKAALTAAAEGTPEAVAEVMNNGSGVVQESGMNLGQNAVNGVTEGINIGLPGVQTSTDAITNATTQGAANAVNGSNAEWSNLGSGVDQGFNQATTAVQQGATNMYNGAKTSFSMLAQIGREAGSSLYNGMSTSLNMLGSNVRTAATSAYLGASTSFNQLAQVGRQAGSSLYNGVTTSMNMLSSNVKTAASSMYVGARTSFTALKTSAISSVTSMCSTITSKWQAMKAVVSAPITASFSVTTTQTTVKKTVNESGGGLWPFAKHAEGGIVNKTHVGMVGEAGPESIIPLSSARRSRGLALWQETGERLGVNVNNKTSNNTVSRVSNNNISKFEPRHQFADRDMTQDRPYYQEAIPNNITNNKGNTNNIDVNVIVNSQNTDNEATIQETLARVEKELREALEDIS